MFTENPLKNDVHVANDVNGKREKSIEKDYMAYIDKRGDFQLTVESIDEYKAKEKERKDLKKRSQ